MNLIIFNPTNNSGSYYYICYNSVQLDIGWDILCVEISLILSEISQLRRSISKTHFLGFLDVYQNLRHVKLQLVVH